MSLPGNVGKIAVLDSRYIIQMQIHLHGFAFLFQEMGTWSLLGAMYAVLGASKDYSINRLSVLNRLGPLPNFSKEGFFAYPSRLKDGFSVLLKKYQ